MMIKVFSITLWIITKDDDKNLYHHLLVSNFTSSDLTENFRSNKMTVKGFSITLWIQKMMVKGFSIIFWRPFVCSSLTSFFNPVYAMFFMQQFWLFIVFLMSHQECHYSQSDMVVIEFTGPRPLYLKSPWLKPRTFQVLGPWPVKSITTMSSWQ